MKTSEIASPWAELSPLPPPSRRLVRVQGHRETCRELWSSSGGSVAPSCELLDSNENRFPCWLKREGGGRGGREGDREGDREGEREGGWK